MDTWEILLISNLYFSVTNIFLKVFQKCSVLFYYESVSNEFIKHLCKWKVFHLSYSGLQHFKLIIHKGHKIVIIPSVVISYIIAQVYYQFTHLLNNIILIFKKQTKERNKTRGIFGYPVLVFRFSNSQKHLSYLAFYYDLPILEDITWWKLFQKNLLNS